MTKENNEFFRANVMDRRHVGASAASGFGLEKLIHDPVVVVILSLPVEDRGVRTQFPAKDEAVVVAHLVRHPAARIIADGFEPIDSQPFTGGRPDRSQRRGPEHPVQSLEERRKMTLVPAHIVVGKGDPGGHRGHQADGSKRRSGSIHVAAEAIGQNQAEAGSGVVGFRRASGWIAYMIPQ